MPKRILPLNAKQIDGAKTTGKAYKLADGYGLYLFVSPTGGKLWRMAYRFDGVPKTLSFGAYPALSLADAREEREKAKKILASGIDPNAAKKTKKKLPQIENPDLFEIVFKEWHSKFKHFKWSDKHARTILDRFEKEVFPYIGADDIKTIEAPTLLTVLRRVEERGALDKASRIREHCTQLWTYAIATGRCTRNVANDLRGALPPVKNNHYPAVTDPVDVAGVIKAIEAYRGSLVVRAALKLAYLTFLRPGELRKGEWSEIDFDNAIWSIPPERMKMKDAHIVPLSSQALAILKDLYPLTKHSKFIFPTPRTHLKCLSDNGVNSALRYMGFEKSFITGHGFRATARTIIDEVLDIRVDYIEHQLSHKVKDPLGNAYNRTKHLKQRAEMMQKWADYLDELAR